MIENLRKFTPLLKEGLKIKATNYKQIKNVVVAAMGASAIPAEVIKEALSIKVPFEISKSYTLPSFVNKNTLLICVSRSGNTKETISQFDQGVKNKCKIITITTGGKLQRKAKKFKKTNLVLPEEFKEKETREIFSYLIGAIIRILNASNLQKEKITFKSLKYKEIENKAKLLAKKINNTFPIICSQYQSVSFRWESQFSENSKTLSESLTLPELAHNEIESWQNLNKNFSVIFLRDKKERKQIKILIESIKRLTNRKTNFFEVWSKGQTRLERMLYLVWLGGFTSYFLGKEKKVKNQKQTKYIEKLKEEIKRIS